MIVSTDLKSENFKIPGNLKIKNIFQKFVVLKILKIKVVEYYNIIK